MVEQSEGTLEELVPWAREPIGWVLRIEDPVFRADSDPQPA
jgi:hypothetical protein